MIDGERVDGHKIAGLTETKGKHNVIIDKTNRQRPRPSTASKGRQQMPDHDVIPALKGRQPAPPSPMPDVVAHGGLTAVLSATPRLKPRPHNPSFREQRTADLDQRSGPRFGPPPPGWTIGATALPGAASGPMASCPGPNPRGRMTSPSPQKCLQPKG